MRSSSGSWRKEVRSSGEGIECQSHERGVSEIIKEKREKKERRMNEVNGMGQ